MESAEYRRVLQLREDRLNTFLDGHNYPRQYPFDPDRTLWATFTGEDPTSFPDSNKLAPRPREYFSIMPDDEKFPVGMTDDERVAFISRFPTLLMPVECDCFRLREIDRAETNEPEGQT